jgi:NADH-quinone oxidoreductase subunit L
MTFLGKPKDEHVFEHAHESPWPMTASLVVLAVLSVVAGFGAWHTQLLSPDAVLPPGTVVGSVEHHEHSGFVMALAIAAGGLGLLLGAWLFLGSPGVREAIRRRLPGLETAFANKFWFDELYREAILRPAYQLATFFAWADGAGVDGAVNGVGRAGVAAARGSGATDRVVVDGAVRLSGAAVLAGGGAVSRTQSGRIRTYLGLGVALVSIVLIVVVTVHLRSRP